MRTAFAVAALFALSAPALGQTAAPPPPAVSVTGEGSVTAVPDLAIITSGVVTRAPTAGAALKANAVAMTKALQALKDAGVAERDFGTSGLSVQPQYDYGDNDNRRPATLVGYEVRNAVTIRALDVGKVGDLVDALVKAGSNQIEGLVFDISDKEAKLDEARRGAIADARRKAALFAEGAGARLGAVLSVEEDSSGGPEPVRAFAMRSKMADAAPATPIARGEQELSVRVSTKWILER